MSRDSVHNSLASISDEWQKLLTHFEWGEGFSFIVVLVPNPQDAEIRRQALERTLAAEHKTITQLRFANPEELTQLAARLLDLQIAADTGAIWVAAVVSEAAPDFAAWQAAWREAVARLNQFRNHIQQRFPVTLLFIGAPWLQETIRTYAPDLWSVRTLVVHIEPQADALRDLHAANARLHPMLEPTEATAPGIALALSAAERLRDKAGSEAERVRYLIRAGNELIYQVGNYRKAQEVLSEAVQLQQQVDPAAESMADTLYYLGVAQDRLSDSQGAESLRQALLLYRRIGSVLGEANCIQGLGDIALRQSQHKKARLRYEEALPLYQRIGDVRGEANCIQRLGDTALEQSQYEEARLRYEEALLLYQRIGNVNGEANCIWRLGDTALEQLQYEEAQLRYEEALPLYQRIGNVRGEANCIQRLGDIALRQSEHKKARLRYEEALSLYQRIGNANGEAISIWGLGNVAMKEEHFADAQKHYEASLLLIRKIGSLHNEGECLVSLGDLAVKLSNHEKAKQYYNEALAIFERIVQAEWIGEVHYRFAKLSGTESERARHLELARAAWLAIGRGDLMKKLEELHV